MATNLISSFHCEMVCKAIASIVSVQVSHNVVKCSFDNDFEESIVL